MVKAGGIVRVCSPRGPRYSGKLIARAVDLYRDGVKPGYIRWHELQYTLEQEFVPEFKQLGQDKPSPETIMAWARKYPDAPERLRDLRIQQFEPARSVLWNSANSPVYQPPQPVAVQCVSPLASDINTLLGQFVGLMFLAMMVYMMKCWLQI